MKIRRIYIFLFFSTLLAIQAAAQQSEHDNYVGVSVDGGIGTTLFNAVHGSPKIGAGFDVGIYYARFFSKLLGINVGLQYSFINSTTAYDEWTQTTEGLTHASNPFVRYNLITRYNNWIECQKIGVISVPVEVLFRKVFNDHWSIKGGVGLSMDVPVNGRYVSKGGTYTNSGLFPSLGNYEVSNMPEHGFGTYSTTQDATIHNHSKIGVSVIGDFGARVAINDNWGMYVGIYVGYGLTNYLAEAKADEMVMINKIDPSIIEYRGTFDSNETRNVHLLRCGFKFAFDFGWPRLENPIIVIDTIPQGPKPGPSNPPDTIVGPESGGGKGPAPVDCKKMIKELLNNKYDSVAVNSTMFTIKFFRMNEDERVKEYCDLYLPYVEKYHEYNEELWKVLDKIRKTYFGDYPSPYDMEKFNRTYHRTKYYQHCDDDGIDGIPYLSNIINEVIKQIENSELSGESLKILMDKLK